MVNRIILNETSYHGAGAIGEIATEAKGRGFAKAFVCSDPDLIKFGVTKKVLDVLEGANLAYEVYSNIKPNPTVENVKTGVEAFKKSGADYIIAEKNRKMVCVDPHHIPVVAFIDPDMMSSMPKGLTAATGMDALTHAIEGFTTKAAWEMTDMMHLKAIEIISKSLRGAVENTPEGREGMALGQYVAGMGFSNVGLGIVHSMAHPLGAVYDTPHGVANAIILPTVMEYNAEATGDKYKYIAAAMGVEGTEKMSVEEYRKAAIDAVKQLSKDVGIPVDLKEIVDPKDLDFLAQSAYDDACRPGNPRDTSVEEIKELYKSLL
ncbi:iron-containing alcohol dehydrogenase [uncultured Eubacterium sp.]|uniref:iron-containing alcohol dehydrogenase n=1 Tax=uncultured Eubacterium sp. TaxID=165185 RepID=UPI002675B1AB|nr:iron-containing alcohol dehydrogenase [uncultured Eubacterium sp.]